MARFSHLLTANTWRYASGWAPDPIAIRELGDDALIEESIGGDNRLTLSVPRTAAGYSQLVPGRVAIVVWADGTWEEFRIVEQVDSATSVGQFVCAGYANILAESPPVRLTDADGVTAHAFELVALDPTTHLTNTVIQALADVGFTFVQLGTIGITTPITIAYDGDSALDAVNAIAEAAGAEWHLTRDDGTSTVKLNLVAQIGAGTTGGALEFGKNAAPVRTRSRVEQVNRLYPLGADGTTIADNRWVVSAITGTTLTLADPNGGDGPIGEDAQLTGLYLEAANRTTRSLISSSTLATQQVVVASATGFAVNDRVRVVAGSTGAGLTHLLSPSSVTAYGTKSGTLDRGDIVGVANLVPNPTMRTWTGAASVAPDGWAAVGSPTLTRTTTAGFFETGGKSCRVQTTTDGHGLATTLVSTRPTALHPYHAGFVRFRLLTGMVRVELVASDGVSSWTLPDGVSQVASPQERDVFTTVGVAGIDLKALGATSVRLRIVQHGTAAADVYVDHAQSTETAGQEPFIDGVGSNLLWQAGNDYLALYAPIRVRYDTPVLDLYRLDGTRYPYDALVMGATHSLNDPALGVADGVRLLGRRRTVMAEGRTEVTLSNRPEDLTSLFARRDPVARAAGNIATDLAVVQARTVTDVVSITTTTITSATAAFQTTDIGKTIWIFGAGTGGGIHRTTITARASTTSITIAANTLKSGTGMTAIFGPADEVLTLGADIGGRRAGGGFSDEAGTLAARVKDAQARDVERMFGKSLLADPDYFDSVPDGSTYLKVIPFLTISATEVAKASTTYTVEITAADPTGGSVTISHNGGAAVTSLGSNQYRIDRLASGSGPLGVLFSVTKTGRVSQATLVIVPEQVAAGTTVPASVDVVLCNNVILADNTFDVVFQVSNAPSGYTLDLDWSHDAVGLELEGTRTAISTTSPYVFNALTYGVLDLVAKGTAGYKSATYTMRLRLKNSGGSLLSTGTDAISVYYIP